MSYNPCAKVIIGLWLADIHSNYWTRVMVSMERTHLDVLIESYWVGDTAIVESKVEVDTSAGVIRLCYPELSQHAHIKHC